MKINKNKKKLFFFSVLAVFLMLLFFVPSNYIQAQGLVPEGCKGDADPSQCNLDTVFVLILNIGNYVLGISGSIALAMFVLGGIYMIVSGGNSGTVEKGQKMMTGAVIGLLIIFGAYVIVDFTVKALTGKGVEDYASQFSTPSVSTGTEEATACPATCPEGQFCKEDTGFLCVACENAVCASDSNCCSGFTCQKSDGQAYGNCKK